MMAPGIRTQQTLEPFLRKTHFSVDREVRAESIHLTSVTGIMVLFSIRRQLE